MVHRRHLHAVILLTLGLLAACGGGGDGGSTGTLALSVTDSPFADPLCLDQAQFTFDGVEARCEGEWITMSLVGADPDTGEVTLDLLALQNALETSLAFGDVPVGALDEMRLHMTRAELLFVGGARQPFQVPSAMSSGLKLKIDPPIMVAPGSTTSLVFDVNVAASFHSTGVGGDPTCDELRLGEAGAKFAPTVRILNKATVGTLRGAVRDSDDTILEGAEVIITAVGSTDPVATAFSADEANPFLDAGAYAVLLEAGTYEVYVGTSEADPVKIETAVPVEIATGEVLVLDLQLPPATE